MIGRGYLFYLKFWIKVTALERNHDHDHDELCDFILSLDVPGLPHKWRILYLCLTCEVGGLKIE